MPHKSFKTELSFSLPLFEQKAHWAEKKEGFYYKRCPRALSAEGDPVLEAE